jgi:predicted adenylyl cyclase CyaB
VIEVEKKAYLRDYKTLDKIREIAQYRGDSEKEDTYFAAIGQKLDLYKDPIFRIRITGNEKILSYKKKRFIEKTEVNEEQEIDISAIDDIQAFRNFFQYTGYYPFIEKKKKTSLYRIENYEGFPVSIEHNKIENLGDFIEIEILVEEKAKEKVEKARQVITKLFHEIDISEEDVEPRYYIDLLMEKS